MDNKQKSVSFSLAFVAMAVILLGGQATARRQILHAEVDGKENPQQTLEMIINDLISATQRARDKVPNLGHSKMVEACDKAYAASLESLNKALGIVKQGPASLKDAAAKEIAASVTTALQAYDTCDDVFAKSTRPSPFIPNNANLKSLGSQCLELTSNKPNNKNN